MDNLPRLRLDHCEKSEKWEFRSNCDQIQIEIERKESRQINNSLPSTAGLVISQKMEEAKSVCEQKVNFLPQVNLSIGQRAKNKKGSIPLPSLEINLFVHDKCLNSKMLLHFYIHLTTKRGLDSIHYSYRKSRSMFVVKKKH